jgi:hypothetical protein
VNTTSKKVYSLGPLRIATPKSRPDVILINSDNGKSISQYLDQLFLDGSMVT